MRYLLSVLAVFLLLSAPLMAEEEKEGKEAGLPRIEMEPFILSLLKRGTVEGKVTVHLTLVISDSKHMEEVRARLPQIRADFMSALTFLSRQRFTVSRPIEPDIVQAYLMPFSDRRLGKGKVSVFVKQAMIEPS